MVVAANSVACSTSTASPAAAVCSSPLALHRWSARWLQIKRRKGRPPKLTNAIGLVLWILTGSGRTRRWRKKMHMKERCSGVCLPLEIVCYTLAWVDTRDEVWAERSLRSAAGSDFSKINIAQVAAPIDPAPPLKIQPELPSQQQVVAMKRSVRELRAKLERESKKYATEVSVLAAENQDGKATFMERLAVWKGKYYNERERHIDTQAGLRAAAQESQRARVAEAATARVRTQLQVQKESNLTLRQELAVCKQKYVKPFFITSRPNLSTLSSWTTADLHQPPFRATAAVCCRPLGRRTDPNGRH